MDFFYDNRVLIVGDFNVPSFCETDNCDGKKKVLANFLEFANLSQYSNVKNLNLRTLDLVCSNVYCEVLPDVHSVVTVDSHHPPITVTLADVLKEHINLLPNFNYKPYNFRKANYLLLYEQLLYTNWDFLASYTDADKAVERFYRELNVIINMCVPVRHNSVCRDSYPPWFTKAVKDGITRKNNAHNKYKIYKTEFYRIKYKNMRSISKKLISDAYRIYVNSVENSISIDSTQFWSFIRSRRGYTRIPGIVYHDGDCFDEPTSIVNAFANYFSSVYIQSDSSCYKSGTCAAANRCINIKKNLMVI